MSKPILIGFFLVLTFGPDASRHFLKPASCTYSAFKSALIKTVDADVLQQDASETSKVGSSDDRQAISYLSWLLIIFILLAASVYLLFEIKKRQAMARQIALLRSELLALFNSAPCGFHSLDEGGVFLNVNNTLLNWLGYEKQEMVGKLKFSQIVEGGEDTATQKTAVVNDNDSRGTTLKLIKKTGERMPVLLNRVRMEGFGSQDGNRFYSTVDHSECQQALERIENLDQELEAFSYSISHDLRAPLRSIDGYSRILQEDYTTKLDEEGRRVLNVIMNNAKRMGMLIDDLLEFGRLGRKNLQRTRIDMTGLVNQIISELRAREPHRKIDVHVGPLHTAYGDADMIRQLWFNLLDNAFKYSSKKELATIEVHSYKTGEGEICYQVSDDGVGFDMKYAPKLFGVFQRLHKIQDFTGTGVGLAMVKRIITRHEGQVWAEGSLTEGAKFNFTIPIENENT